MKPQPGFKIKEIHAFIATEEDGTEGVPAFQGPDGMVVPLLAADPARLVSLAPIAEQIQKESGVPMVLAKFSVREDIKAVGTAKEEE